MVQNGCKIQSFLPVFSLFWCFFSTWFVDRISNFYINSRYISKFEKMHESRPEDALVKLWRLWRMWRLLRLLRLYQISCWVLTCWRVVYLFERDQRSWEKQEEKGECTHHENQLLCVDDWGDHTFIIGIGMNQMKTNILNESTTTNNKHQTHSL